MKITETHLKGCYVIEPTIHEDERGSFFESFNQKEFEETLGQKIQFVQDNHSISRKGVLRGLHFQKGKYAQSKLVRVTHGAALDVVVDLRKGSTTFGNYFKIKLSDQNNKIVFMPKGMAHGFLSLCNDTHFVYKCDAYYNKEAEGGILYNDPDLGIDWELPLEEIILSPKDMELRSFKDFTK
ncbi:dTDP-4-dehydrorhamnose 3,5-epimerase [Spongiimicrobium sp. 3-5]|uniref:dTDP-4-dehydrorhamnose 3,5-epimerase n=1 Tax=Spongiimicrobium sp. 3-5 TaxID=3332596 RepID=UPI00397F3D7C